MIHIPSRQKRLNKRCIMRSFSSPITIALIITLIAGLLPGSPFASLLTPGKAFAALPDADPAIINYPSQYADWIAGSNMAIPIQLDTIDWTNLIDHVGYDSRAYTEAISAAYNGHATPQHIVFDGNNARFLGYDIPPYMDMAFTDAYADGFASVSFMMQPVVMNFHTFSETGLLFKGSFSGQLYTGYALVLKCDNMEGMQSSGTATLSLYYCQNEPMDDSSFKPGTPATTRTLVGTYKTGIQNLTTPAFHVMVTSLRGGGFQLYLDEQLVAEVRHPKSSANGFGFFTGYYRHSCQILTVVEYEELIIRINTAPSETHATVRFVDLVSGNEIAAPQTTAQNATVSYVGDSFKVLAPANIGDFRFVTADRTLDPIRYAKDPARNIVTLYYDTDVSAEKSAATNGVANNGTADAPVPVIPGEKIDYCISVTNPGSEHQVPTQTQPPKAVTVSAGGSHSLALDDDGRVWAWGNNANGQLGDATTTQKTTPVTVDTSLMGARVTAISAGGTHSLALDEDGRVWAWGNNANGQLGSGGSGNSTTPVAVDSSLMNAKIVAISAGGSHSLAIDENGQVWAWGLNGYGQLGDGTTFDSNVPVSVRIYDLDALNLRLVAISAGGSHSLGLDNNGGVWAWGLNTNGQLGDGTAAGGSSMPQPVSSTFNDSAITAVSAGGTHSLAIGDDGRVWAWGNNANGRLGDGTQTQRTTPVPVDSLFGVAWITAISAGDAHSLAINESGQVWAWGLNTNGRLGDNSTAQRLLPVSVNTNLMNAGIQVVSAGDSHSLGLDVNGNVWGWGNNANGRLGDGTTGQRTTPAKNATLYQYIYITALAGGESFHTALDEDGQVWGWGSDVYGQLGDDSAGTGLQRRLPVRVASDFGGARVVAIDCGSYHSLALDDRGRVWTWGANSTGQLGDGSTNQHNTPVLVASDFGGARIVALAAGANHNLALDDRGRVWTWGANTAGQLGDGSLNQSNTPVLVASDFGGARIVALAASGNHSLGLDERGQVWAWGQNNYGQLGLGNTNNQRLPVRVNTSLMNDKIVAVAAGNLHCLALDANGRVWAWGFGDSGRLGNGSTTQSSLPVQVGGGFGGARVTAIWAGYDYSFALDENNLVWAWGANSTGQLGDGSTGAGANKSTPVQIPTLNGKGITTIACGRGHNMAADTSGNVWAWGVNSSYQLADGSNTQRSTPFTHGVLRSRVRPFSVTDLLPAGLTYADSLYATTDDGFTTVDLGTLTASCTVGDDGRDLVTITFTRLPQGTIELHFSAQVATGSASRVFVNRATFTDGIQGRQTSTNQTWHATGCVTVTEKYRALDSGDSLQDDTYRGFGLDPALRDYSPYPSTMRPISAPGGVVWRYYAYRIDDGDLVVGAPPNGIYGDWCIANVNANHDVFLYFVRDLVLQIDYKDDADRTGVNLKARYTTGIAALQNYSLPASHLGSIENSGGTWNYANHYSLDGGTTVLSGVPPLPTFGAAGLNTDRHIVLYFTQNPVVEVRYREYRADATERANSQMLLDAAGVSGMSFVLESQAPYSFDPMAQAPVAGAVQNGTRSVLGQEYREYKGWSIEDGTDDAGGASGAALNPGPPPLFDDLQGGERITLYFSTSYRVSELFHANDCTQEPHHAASELKAPVYTDVSGGEAFHGSAPGYQAPPDFYAQGYQWAYIGWVMDRIDPDFSDVDPADYSSLVDGVVPPVVDEVNAPGLTIIYIYQRLEPSDRISVTERFRERDNTGHILADDRLSDVALGTAFSGSWPLAISPAGEGIRYAYWGYQIDAAAPVPGAFPGIATIDQGFTVTYLYTSSQVTDVTISGNKVLAGISETNRRFTFRATQVEALNSFAPAGTLSGSVTITGGGVFTVVIDDLEVNGSPYYFAITEVDESGSGWTYDSHAFWVEVSVAPTMSGAVSAEVTRVSGSTSFINRYAASPGSIDLVLIGTKTATGKTLTNGQFSFAVYEGTTVVATATNRADGGIRFSPIVYTEAGEHTYTVRETSLSAGGWKTDATVYTVTVVVADEGGGGGEGGASRLSATASYPTGGLVFKNTYTSPDEKPPSPPPNPPLAPTGDNSVFIWIALGVMLAAGVLILLIARRKRSD